MSQSKILKLKTPIQLSKKDRWMSFIISVCFVSISGMMHLFYRPYIYSNHIYDFHLSDCYSNLLAVPAGAFFCISWKKTLEYKAIYYVVSACLAFIIYEFVGLTFDYLDIIATIISGIVTTLGLTYVFHKFNVK